MWNDRTKILIGENGVSTLKNKHVAVVGIGGVGGYVCLMLVRAGIENLTIIDFDTVDETNINRQVVATTKTIGQKKTDVMKQIIYEINPNCIVKAKDARLTRSEVKNLLNEEYDYIVDCIDSVTDKIELICFCKQNNLNIVSATGTGNRIDLPNFKAMDIYKTSNDGLAKVLRKKLRERNIGSLDVITSESKPLKTKQLGSISYYPAMCGCVLGAFVINKLLN